MPSHPGLIINDLPRPALRGRVGVSGMKGELWRAAQMVGRSRSPSVTVV